MTRPRPRPRREPFARQIARMEDLGAPDARGNPESRAIFTRWARERAARAAHARRRREPTP